MSAKELRDQHGNLVDDDYIAEAAAEFANADLTDVKRWVRKPGAPSLHGGRGESPRISVRVAPDVLERAKARAEHEGRKLSDVARELIERYAG